MYLLSCNAILAIAHFNAKYATLTCEDCLGASERKSREKRYIQRNESSYHKVTKRTLCALCYVSWIHISDIKSTIVVSVVVVVVILLV